MFGKIVHIIIPAIIRKYKSEGFVGVIEGIKYQRNKSFVQKQRCLISYRVARKANFTVQYGPFKGLKLKEKEKWGCDQGTKCMGLYEQQIQDALVRIRHDRGRTVFFDIGGADGYFAVGGLKNGLFDFVYVFEKDSEGRCNIEDVSKINGVQEKIEIHGEVSQPTIRNILSTHPDLVLEKSVFLVDIEGAEFQIFDNEFLEFLSPADLIIEVHDATPNRQRFEKFKRSIKSHEVHELIYSSRNPKELKELAMLMDDDCWLLMSEGRYPMKWLYLKSRSHDSNMTC